MTTPKKRRKHPSTASEEEGKALPRPRHALYPNDGEIQFEVLALRRRRNFGRRDYLIEPTKGRGAKWTTERKLRFLDEDQPEERGEDDE